MNTVNYIFQSYSYAVLIFYRNWCLQEWCHPCIQIRYPCSFYPWFDLLQMKRFCHIWVQGLLQGGIRLSLGWGLNLQTLSQWATLGGKYSCSWQNSMPNWEHKTKSFIYKGKRYMIEIILPMYRQTFKLVPKPTKTICFIGKRHLDFNITFFLHFTWTINSFDK